MPAISIKNLSKTYANGTQALKNVDLDVEAGDFFALLGANGAGKTTLIGILTGLVNKTAGTVKILDIDIDQDFSRAKRLIGVVPQEFNFNMFEKVQDILVTQAGYFGIPYRPAAQEAESLLKRLGLWEKRNVPSRSLSGGMKRRLMIARALIHKPKLLILDEPTAGVDVELRHGMWDYLRRLNEEGVTILLTTHYLEEVEQMCRNAAIIKEGIIYKHDRVSRLVRGMEQETYAVTVAEIRNLEKIKQFNPVTTDTHTFEVEMNRREKLHDFLLQLGAAGMILEDIRPKGHRLEKLFMNILKERV